MCATAVSENFVSFSNKGKKPAIIQWWDSPVLEYNINDGGSKAQVFSYSILHMRKCASAVKTIQHLAACLLSHKAVVTQTEVCFVAGMLDVDSAGLN